MDAVESSGLYCRCRTFGHGTPRRGRGPDALPLPGRRLGACLALILVAVALAGFRQASEKLLQPQNMRLGDQRARDLDAQMQAPLLDGTPVITKAPAVWGEFKD